MAGRKSIKYDPEIAGKIKAMRQYGLSIEQVCTLVSLSAPSLYRLYKKELEEGAAAANLIVGKKLFERCQAGDVAALIFWAKTRMGWREKDNTPQVTKENDNQELAKAIQNAMRSVGE